MSLSLPIQESTQPMPLCRLPSDQVCWQMQAGFSLVELAVVAAVISLMLGGLLLSFRTQVEMQRVSNTSKTLELAMEAVIGYAIRNGRIPCPATAASGGTEQLNSLGVGTLQMCSLFNGFLPARTLGIGPTDAQGYLLDSYGMRIRYSVNNRRHFSNRPAALKGEVQTNGFSSNNLEADLRICSSANGIVSPGSQSDAECGTGRFLSSDAVLAIYSTGANAATTGAAAVASPDEAANYISDRVLVWHAPSNSPGSEFDDLLIWLSLSSFVAKMTSAGAL